MTTHFQMDYRHLQGGVLDPQIEAFLKAMEEEGGDPVETLSPEEARIGVNQRVVETSGDGEPVAYVEDRTLPSPEGEIPVRIFTPEGKGPFPVLVYFHGGGWVICNVSTHEAPCRALCNRANCMVVAVDYRLSPEHKYPAANQDAFYTIKWLVEHGSEINADPTRIAVGGDSAGGNMSAVTALRCRNENGPALAFQLLIYPVTDMSWMGNETYQAFAEGYFLTKNMMEWFRFHYLNTEDEALTSYVSPLLEADLSNLPPALVITAEFDPLRMEGEEYARRLHKAGNQVQCTRYNGMIHPFWSMAGVTDQAIAAYQQAADALKQAFQKI